METDFSEDEISSSRNEDVLQVPKSSKARVRAENEDAKILISGLALKLNVLEKERIAVNTLPKWISKNGSVPAYVASSPVLEGSKNAQKSLKLFC